MKRCLWRFAFPLLLAVGLVWSSCSSTAARPGTVTDDLGRSVSLEKAPQKVVSLAPSTTELLFALGLGDRVVGVDSFSDYPEAARSKPTVGGYTDTDIEKVVSLQPDLVLATGPHQAEVIPALEKASMKVLGLDAVTLDGILNDIKLLGEVAGANREAERLIGELRARIDEVVARTGAAGAAKRPRVLFVVWHDPVWTAGSGTLANDVIEKAGGVNIAAGMTGYQTMSLEAIVAADPEVILVVTSHGDDRDASFLWANAEGRLAVVSARLSSPPRVYQIDGDLIGRATPRTVDALEVVARLIHPELE